MNSAAQNAIAKNPGMRIFTDVHGREWITVKSRNGFDRLQWWSRPINAAAHEDFKMAGATIAERDRILNDVSDEWIAQTWKFDNGEAELERRIRKYTGFSSFDDLVNAAGNYVPTIRIDSQPELRMVAEAYDAHMESIGSLKRAFVTYPRSEQQKRDKIAVAAWKEERRLERERRIAAAELKTLNNAHAEALKINEQMKLDNPKTPVEMAKSATAAARKCIENARRDRERFYSKTHFTHRSVDVVAINADGERCGDGSPIFLELSQLSGRALKDAAAELRRHYDDVVEICVQGGIDAHESFAAFMRDAREYGWGDYDPQVDEWEVSAPVEIFD